VNAAVVDEIPVPTKSVGVTRIITLEFVVYPISLALSHMNVCAITPVLDVKPAVPSPPETGVAAHQMLPPLGLYWTWTLQSKPPASARI
jgi:hypothetical protein